MTRTGNFLPDAPATAILSEALANLRLQGIRSLLALLGILIGTGAIVALINIGHIAQLESLKLFQNMGIDMVQIQAIPTGAGPAGFDRQIAETLLAAMPQVKQAVPLAIGRAMLSSNRQQADAGIVAMTADLNQLANLKTIAGRKLAAIDDCSFSAVVGNQLAKKLSSPLHDLRIDDVIIIGDYGFAVIGILAPMVAESLNPTDYNDAIFLSLACSRRVLPGADPTVALVQVQPETDVEAVGERIAKHLTRPGSTLQVLSARTMIESMNAQKSVHSNLLTAIGTISLLVGGIGVLNVMLMSQMERRREIGLRAALGATPRDIQAMFIVEAAILTLFGGLIGALVGVIAAWLVAMSSGWDFGLAWWSLALAPTISMLVGLIFGLYPAIAASRLRPIEALRAE